MTLIGMKIIHVLAVHVIIAQIFTHVLDSVQLKPTAKLR